jgi:tRNA nucleotidyltransferase (CCA-adding enzyme)
MNEQFLAAQKVIVALKHAGYEAYLVGGCVRDHLLGKEPADYDITTNAFPWEVQKIFPRNIPTGLKHGTISVIQDQSVLEVTTFRVEGNYEDHRRPGKVKFVSSLRDDLMRRDFTINAMAMDVNGDVIDYADGRTDLDTGWIRTVGKAGDRFAEDALRMVRACRFAAQLSFTIEEKTKEAIRDCKVYANHIAVERMVAEFTKIWSSKYPSKGLMPLIETGLLAELPPFCNVSIAPNVCSQEWGNLDHLANQIEKWVYFLYLVFRNDNRRQVCNTNIIALLPKFKFSNTKKKAIASLTSLVADWNPDISIKTGKLMLLKHPMERVQSAEKLWNLISQKQTSLPWEKWWKDMPIHHFPELAINGNDLLQVTGKKPGPWLKETLQYLFQQVAFGSIRNEKRDLEKEGRNYGTGITS